MESEAPKHKAQPPLSFGLLLKPDLATSVLERGPPADSPKVNSHVISYLCRNQAYLVCFCVVDLFLLYHLCVAVLVHICIFLTTVFVFLPGG